MKVTTLTAVASLLVLSLLSGCATMGKADPEAFATYIESTWESYSAALVAGDTESWIKLWDEEGVQLPPGAPMVIGKPAIKARIDGANAAMDWQQFEIKISGTFVDREFGFAYGNYTFTVQPKAGGPKINGDGKYETIFRKQSDGSWKIFRDCFNSNLPPQ